MTVAVPLSFATDKAAYFKGGGASFWLTADQFAALGKPANLTVTIAADQEDS